MDSPVVSRVRLPEVYGAPQDSPLLDWPSVEQRLTKAPRYWISTAEPGGVPISRPVDGNWIRGALYFGGDPKACWRRNLAANPQACVTLENAESPIILEGSVETLLPDEELAQILARSAQAKYGWGSVEWFRQDCPTAVAFGFACGPARPRRVMTWSGVFEHATRFTFD